MLTKERAELIDLRKRHDLHHKCCSEDENGDVTHHRTDGAAAVVVDRLVVAENNHRRTDAKQATKHQRRGHEVVGHREPSSRHVVVRRSELHHVRRVREAGAHDAHPGVPQKPRRERDDVLASPLTVVSGPAHARAGEAVNDDYGPPTEQRVQRVGDPGIDTALVQPYPRRCS